MTHEAKMHNIGTAVSDCEHFMRIVYKTELDSVDWMQYFITLHGLSGLQKSVQEAQERMQREDRHIPA